MTPSTRQAFFSPACRLMRRWPLMCASLALLWALPAWAAAQEQADPVPRQEMPRYDPRGRRDPFISLRALRQEPAADLLAPPPLSQRPPGLPGLLVDEVTVVGIVAGIDQPIALLRGVDDFTYFARPGDQLFDGHVIEINGERVLFRREVTDARGDKHRSRVTKRLNSQEIQVVEEKGGNPDEEL